MLLFVCLLILSIATPSRATTCGYKDGDPNNARTAQPGYACRVDTANGLWGFCPSTVISARDCGLAGVCVDSHTCTEGCGRLTNRADITTFSCERSQFCSTVLLLNGPDQSFEYIACGAAAQTDRLFPVPNTAEVTTTSSSSSTSLLSSFSTSPASRPTVTVVETSSGPASGSSSGLTSSTTPSTSSPISASSKQEPMNIGAIVGGAIAGLTVICLTILGVVLIRRKNGAKRQATSPSGHANQGWNKFADDATTQTKKNHQWDSSHGPVEMYSGHHVDMEPVELSAHVQHLEFPKGTAT